MRIREYDWRERIRLLNDRERERESVLSAHNGEFIAHQPVPNSLEEMKWVTDGEIIEQNPWNDRVSHPHIGISI
jgi:hypothetical protein